MPYGIEEAASAAIGLALEQHNDERQKRQQAALQKIQMEGQKEMGKYNQGLALDMWNKTNYGAQIQHMKNAGLNIGLMYGMGGGGGTTASTPTGNVGGATAQQVPGEVGMGLQLGLQKAMQEAQIKVAEAQAKNLNADTEVKLGQPGVQEQGIKESQARTANIQQATSNAELQGRILQWEEQLKGIETNIRSTTSQELIRTIQAGATKLEQEAEQAKAATPEFKKQVALTTLQQAATLSLTKLQQDKTIQDTEHSKAQVAKMNDEITQIYNQIKNDNARVSIQAAEQEIHKQLADFSTRDIKNYQDWIGAWRQVLDGINNTIKTLK